MKKSLQKIFLITVLMFFALPWQAQAAISFVGSAENSSSPNVDTTVDISGIGLLEGDIVIVSAGIGDNDSVDLDMTMVTAGYTEVVDIHAPTDTQDVDLGVWWKIMGATPDSDVTVDGLGGADAALAVVVMAFRGVDTTTPMDVTPTTASANNTMHADPPSIDHGNPSGVWTVIAGTSGHTLLGAGTYTFPTGYTTNAIDRGHDDTNDVTVGMGYRSSGVSDPEDPGIMTHSGTDSANFVWAAATMALRPEIPSTTLADGTDPGPATLAPEDTVTDIDAFTFQTSSGTDNITALTVQILPPSATTTISLVEVTDNSNVDKCIDIANPTSNTLNFTGCSLAVTTSATTFKIRVTPKTHANMPAVPGASFAVTATTTAWTGTNTTHAGTDTDSATVTIDNASPADATGASVSSTIDSQTSLSWTNPGDSDFDEVVILRRAGSAVTDAPTEGTNYATSTAVGSSAVACVGKMTSCVDTGLTNGTAYHYKIFAQDTRGNYSSAGVVPSGSPVTPAAATLELSAYRMFASSTSATPGAAMEIQDTAATLPYAGAEFRMRLLLHVGTNGIAANGTTTKLQLAEKSGTCDSGFSGETYADVTTATAISYFDTVGINDDIALGAEGGLTHGADAIVNQTYEELNNFTNSQSLISAGQDGKWDFSLYDNGAAAGSSYCLRVVQSGGGLLNTYTQIPEIAIPAGAPAISQAHYRWRNDDGSEAGATFAAAEDTALADNVYVGDRRRLRILLSNTGTGSATNFTYRLEHASSSCTAWLPVPSAAAGEHWAMDASSFLPDGQATTDLAGLTNPGGKTFASGFAKTTANQTSAHNLSDSQFTELEYAVKSTANVSPDTTYCFRVTNAGSITNFTYTAQPQVSVQANTARPTSGGGAGGGEGSGSGTPVAGGGAGGGTPPPGEGSGSGATVGNKTTYATAGAGTYTVPGGVTLIVVKAWGAGADGGGQTGGAAGGGGGFAQATLSVTPGEILDVIVGSNTGGGGKGIGTGGFGGGYSAVKRSVTFLVQAGAGGGGGGGEQGNPGGFGGAGGAGGGINGGNGAAGTGGGGGTSSAGGAGGSTGGVAGSANTGGAGSGGTLNNGGGGGGGSGRFGGGGGGDGMGGGGGGGGSSLVTGTNTLQITGSGTIPGNNTDVDYAGNAGQGGAAGDGVGNAGRVVIIAELPQGGGGGGGGDSGYIENRASFLASVFQARYDISNRISEFVKRGIGEIVTGFVHLIIR